MSDLIHHIWPVTVDGLTDGAIYALIALGYTLVYGVLRLINFAHSEVFMVGTFGALLTVHAMGIDTTDPPKAGLTLVAVLIIAGVAAMAASGATAVLLERIAYRPLRKRGASRLAALISAIGASFFLQEVFAKWRGRNAEPLPRVLHRFRITDAGHMDLRNDKLVVIVAAIVMMIILNRFVSTTRLGRGIRAVAQDAETASLMGVNIDRVVMFTFLIGGIMAGAAGMLFILERENTVYNIGFVLGIKAFTAAVLGGIGNLRGALLGGLALGVIENYGASIFGSGWKDVVAFSVLVIVLMFRPTGLLGESLAKARA